MGGKNKKNLGIHLGLLVAETICFAGFFIELGRANGGNALSWAYVVEWPIFALYAIYMWWRLRREEVGETPHSNPPREDHSDEALERYNNYLAQVNPESASDPKATNNP